MASSVLLFLFVRLSLAAKQCYFTDGSPADNDFPCVDDAGESAVPCCGSGNICLTNGLCFDGLTINRGSCTDKSWNSNLCTQICTQNLYSGLWPCDADGGYSCTYGDCDNPFTLSAARIQINTVLEKSLGLDSPTATVTSSPNTATVTTTISPQASSIGGVDASQGISPGAAAGIGAGVGIPLLCTTLAATILFLLERKKRRRLETSAYVGSPSHGQGQVNDYAAAPKFGGYQQLSPAQQSHEMNGFNRQELGNTQPIPELAGHPK